jgi:hypothetical protein
MATYPYETVFGVMVETAPDPFNNSFTINTSTGVLTGLPHIVGETSANELAAYLLSEVTLIPGGTSKKEGGDVTQIYLLDKKGYLCLRLLLRKFVGAGGAGLIYLGIAPEIPGGPVLYVVSSSVDKSLEDFVLAGKLAYNLVTAENLGAKVPANTSWYEAVLA